MLASYLIVITWLSAQPIISNNRQDIVSIINHSPMCYCVTVPVTIQDFKDNKLPNNTDGSSNSAHDTLCKLLQNSNK